MRRFIFNLMLVDFLIVLLLVLFPPWGTALQISQPHEIDFWWIGSTPPSFHEPGAALGGFAYHIYLDRLVGRIGMVLVSSVIVALVAAYTSRHQNPK